MSKNFSIHIEGTIGAGKSTFLSQFSGNPFLTVLPEDLEKWLAVPETPCKPGEKMDNNLLAKFYGSPKDYAFQFETYVLLTKKQCHAANVGTPIKVMERSVQSAFDVFSRLLVEAKLMEPVEFAVLQEMAKDYMSNNGCRVDLWVYIRTPAETALDRIRKRARVEEAEMTLEYLQTLEKAYDRFFENVSEPVILIDGSASIEEVFETTKDQIACKLPAEFAKMLLD
jgi:deoxynucleoside kinase